MKKEVKHPVQPVVIDSFGVYRFKENRIVSKLLELAVQNGRKYNMNEIYIDYADGKFSRNEMVQFAQLTGYSVSGWSGLGYVSDKDYEAAEAKIEKMKKRNGIEEEG